MSNYDKAYLHCGREYGSTYTDKADKKFKLFFRLHCKKCEMCRNNPLITSEHSGFFDPNKTTALLSYIQSSKALDAQPVYAHLN